MPTVGAGFIRCFPGVKQAKLFSIALFVIISVAPPHFVVRVWAIRVTVVAVKAFLKLIVSYVCPSRESVKVPVDWAIPACVRNKVASMVKIITFYHIWFGLCVSIPPKALKAEPQPLKTQANEDRIDPRAPGQWIFARGALVSASAALAI